jgi:hypothetical protein
MIDGQEDATTGALFYGLSNANGSEILDKNHYFEDYIVYLDGLSDVLRLSEISVLSSFLQLKNSKFYDSNNPKGYFSYLNENRTKNSGIKEFDDNIQILLTFADWAVSSVYDGEIYELGTSLNDAWLALENNFLDSTSSYKGFNHTINITEYYIRDQLMAAIAGFQLYRADKLTDEAHKTVAARANSTATSIMQHLLNTTDSSNLIYDNYNSFQFRRNANYAKPTGQGYTDKELTTNAYGIWALCEYYLQSKMSLPGVLEKAEKTYQFLNSSLWNSTFKLYSTNTSQDGLLISNKSMMLKDNAIMMTALTKLFETTGNMTYFERIMELLEGIKTYLYDDLFGNYYTSINPENLVKDTNKSFNAHAYLFRAYRTVSELYQYLSTTLDLNSTQIVKSIESIVNITLRMNMDVKKNLTLGNGDKIYFEKKINITNPNMFVVTRFPNGSVIDSYNLNGTEFGNASMNISLYENYPIGEYTIAMYANYTGLYTIFNFTSFNLISGLSLKNYTWNSTKLYPSETYNLNLTINSTRYDNNSFNIECESEIFDGKPLFINNVIDNGTVKNVSLSLPISAGANFGKFPLYLLFYHNNTLYDNITINVEILSPVEVIQIVQEKIGVQNFEYSTRVYLKSLISKPINCSILFSSESFAANDSKIVDLAAFSSKNITMNTTISNTTSIGMSEFQINISRTIDSELIISQKFYLETKNKFEILGLQMAANSIHWEQNYALLQIINNAPIDQDITVRINNKLIKGSFPVIYGINSINIPVINNWNAYSLGDQYFVMQIYDGNTLIYEETLVTRFSVSVASLIVGYIIPILIPLIGVVIFRHMELENKKRLI